MSSLHWDLIGEDLNPGL